MLKRVAKMNKNDRKQEIFDEISKLDKQRKDIEEKIEELRSEALSLKIAPFKVGDIIYMDLKSGKTSKVQKCVLESVGANLYVRPYKNDGELSGRHFYVCSYYSDINCAEIFKEEE